MSKLTELFKVSMVNNQVESYVYKVDLLNLIIKFSSLKNFKGISVNVEDSVRFNFGVTTLYEGFFIGRDDLGHLTVLLRL